MCKYCGDFESARARYSTLLGVELALQDRGYTSDARVVHTLVEDARNDVKTFQRWVEKGHKGEA